MYSSFVLILNIICTQLQYRNYEFEFKKIKDSNKNVEVHKIEAHNLGPTFSVRQLNLNDNSPILIHYCDFLVNMDFEPLVLSLKKNRIVAPYFKDFHPASLGTTKFAYMKVDPLGQLICLKENCRRQ